MDIKHFELLSSTVSAVKPLSPTTVCEQDMIMTADVSQICETAEELPLDAIHDLLV